MVGSTWRIGVRGKRDASAAWEKGGWNLPLDGFRKEFAWVPTYAFNFFSQRFERVWFRKILRYRANHCIANFSRNLYILYDPLVEGAIAVGSVDNRILIEGWMNATKIPGWHWIDRHEFE